MGQFLFILSNIYRCALEIWLVLRWLRNGEEVYQVWHIVTAAIWPMESETLLILRKIISWYFACQSRIIQIISHNRQERRNTYNVIGIMKGEIEPGRIDQYPSIEQSWSRSNFRSLRCHWKSSVSGVISIIWTFHLSFIQWSLETHGV